MGRPTKLSESEIAEMMSRVPGWEYREGALRRDLTFPDFKRAFGFMTSVALAAEARDHHPEWNNVYNRVSIAWSTHDAGGVTTLDFDLAEQVSKLADGS
jgi:4a-hydroxytetrahydrobiopterin dehydratase